jgi:hypothetical protein
MVLFQVLVRVPLLEDVGVAQECCICCAGARVGLTIDPQMHDRDTRNPRNAGANDTVRRSSKRGHGAYRVNDQTDRLLSPTAEKSSGCAK